MKRIVTIISTLVLASMLVGFDAAAQSVSESSPVASPSASPAAADYEEGSYDYVSDTGDQLSIRIVEIPAGTGEEVLAAMDSFRDEPLTGTEFVDELDAEEGCRLFEFDADGTSIFAMVCVNDSVSMIAVGTNEDHIRTTADNFIAGDSNLVPEGYEESGG